MATLLSICQSVSDRIGLARPTQVASSIDQTVRTLLGCAQREGVSLSRRWAWQALLREHTFVSVAATAQTNSIPTDWDGRMVADTFWNRTKKWRVSGPLLSSEWQTIQASGINAIIDGYRFRNNLIELVPTPVAGSTYAFEYASRNWCTTAAGAPLSAWGTDTDINVLDTELLTLGIIWRFLQGRGMDFTAALADYEGEVMNAIGRDGSRRVVSLADGGRGTAARFPAIPDGSWNL